MNASDITIQNTYWSPDNLVMICIISVRYGHEHDELYEQTSMIVDL